MPMLLLPCLMDIDDRNNLVTFPEVLKFFNVKDPEFAGARLELLALYYLLRGKKKK